VISDFPIRKRERLNARIFAKNAHSAGIGETKINRFHKMRLIYKRKRAVKTSPSFIFFETKNILARVRSAPYHNTII
jgi:hypothetical protein